MSNTYKSYAGIVDAIYVIMWIEISRFNELVIALFDAIYVIMWIEIRPLG